MSSDFLNNSRLSLGEVALSQPARATLLGSSLIIQSADGTRRDWPLAGLVAGVPVTRGLDDVVLTSAEAPGATLFLDDPGLIAELVRREPRLGAGATRWRRARPGLAAAAVAGAVVAALWAAGVSPASVIAHRLPDAARARFGANVVKTLTGNASPCSARAGAAALKALTLRLTASVPEAKDFEIAVVNWRVVNAYTAPGGRIIVARGLLDKAQSPDELAGVIAHEMGHAIERHPEAGIIRAIGLSAAAELMLGGSSGTLGNVGILLAQMSFTREAEREADNHAFRLLKLARISPKGIAAFFRRMNAIQGEQGGQGLAIFASHPASMERAALAESQPGYATTPALEAADWLALQAICGPAPAPKPAAPPASPAPTSPPPTAAPPPSDRPAVPPSANAPAGSAADQNAVSKVIIETTAALVLNPGDPDLLRRRAEAYWKERNYALAEKDASAVLAARPGDVTALRLRGAARLAQSNAAAAVEDFSAVLKTNPKEAIVLAERGRAYLALKRPDDAITDLRAVIALRRVASDHNNLGVALERKGDTAAAIGEYTEALAIDGKYLTALVNRGRLLEKAGKRDEAIADYTAAVALPPPAPERDPVAAKLQTTAREHLKALSGPKGP
jgi:beta-barrel assembly-enhancing protease